MTGETMFEHPATLHHAEGLDWMRRDKEMLHDRQHMPSPTYTHSTDSVPSPYNMPQTATATTSYHPYPPSAPHSHSHPRYTHQPQYNSSGEYDVFQTPTAPHRAGFEYPQPIIYDPHASHQAQPPLLTTSTLNRSYDSTIPQYYPVMAERSWSKTPDKAGKRKREKGKDVALPMPMSAPTAPASITNLGTPTPVKPLKTPKKAKASPEERAAKRAKTTSMGTSQVPLSAPSQLPTPPPTGRETPATLHLPPPPTLPSPPALAAATQPLESPSEVSETSIKRGLRVTRSDEEGRKLAVGQVLDDGELSPVESKPQRLAPAPRIVTADNGVAAVATHPILESELAWLESAGRPVSPSSPSDGMIVRTPEISMLLVDEEEDAPDVKADKVSKRLLAFSSESKAEPMPMMCTKIDAFGRVAVRKDAAVKFLGLEMDAGASVVEQTKEDDEWVESSIAGSSRLHVKPSWPEELSAWSISASRIRRQREENERTALLKRYMESSGDEASDEEVVYPTMFHGKGKGKSVSRLVRVTAADSDDPRRRLRIDVNADAKSALLTTLRNRALPAQTMGVVACACGGREANGTSAMLACANCKTWHHTVCNGVDEAQLAAASAGRWWCPNCETQMMRIMTPAQTPRRAFTQSDERSSAFKGQANDIALAPSPMFIASATFSQAAAAIRTPLNRSAASPTSRNHRSRILSYGTDMWASSFAEEGGLLPTPSTPVPADARFTTPRIDDAPFDVTSTPSRHIDFNFGGGGGPSLFSMTPLGGRSRIPSTMMSDTPLTYRHRLASQSDGGALAMGGRHDFLRDLAGPSGATGAGAGSSGLAHPPFPPASPSRWPPHSLLGAGSINPSALGHRRTLSGNKMSSMRSSSRSGLGLGLPIGAHQNEDEE